MVGKEMNRWEVTGTVKRGVWVGGRCMGNPLSFFFLAMPGGMWDLPQPEMEPTRPAVEAQSLNHWTTEEVPLFFSRMRPKGRSPSYTMCAPGGLLAGSSGQPCRFTQDRSVCLAPCGCVFHKDPSSSGL